MTALLLTHLALVLLIGGLRFGADLDLFLGFALSPERWAMATGVLLGLAGLALRREVLERRPPWRGRERAAVWSLLVLVPALHWAFGDEVMQWGVDAVLLLLAAVVGWAVVLARPVARSGRFWWGDRARPLLVLVLFTGVGLTLLLTLGDARGAGPLPWLTYPLYALVQLGLLLELPERLWSREGVGRLARVLGLSLLFAMVHGPNPVVLLLTAIGMAVWASARIAGAGLLPLALSMGLLGAAAAQALPEESTQHMRVGPGFVLKQARERALLRYDERVGRLASDATFQRAGGTLAGWLDLVHREVFGEAMDEATREGWIALVDARHRAHVVRVVLESEEYRRAHGIQRIMEGSDRSLLFSTFRPWHPAQEPYDELVERARRNATSETHADFVRHVFEVLLGRTPSARGLEEWSPWPAAIRREEIVRRFLEEAGVEDPASWRRPERPLPWPAGPR